MVTFVDPINTLNQIHNPINTRTHKRVGLKLNLVVRRLFNSSFYGKVVETVDISAKGLMVVCDVNLEVGAELEITSVNRNVNVTAIVKHSRRDDFSGKYFLGLAITEKKTNWFVLEPLIQPTTGFSLATEQIC